MSQTTTASMEPSSVEDGNIRQAVRLLMEKFASMEPSSVEDGNPPATADTLPASSGFNGAVLS